LLSRQLFKKVHLPKIFSQTENTKQLNRSIRLYCQKPYFCGMQPDHATKRILVIQTASIGDVILVTPVLEKLHHAYPESRIDLLIRAGFEGLFDRHPFLNTLLLWDKKEKKYRKLFHLLRLIRRSRYDLVITAQRFASSGLLAAFSGAKTTVGFHKNPFSIFFSKSIRHNISKEGSLHETERNLGLVDWIAGRADARPRLYPAAVNYARTSPYKTHKYICLAPASLWYTKQYPEEQWIDFLSHTDPEIHVYLLGSASDKVLCDRIMQQSKHPNTLNLAGALSLLDSAALMQDAAMNFVNDSAPMHLGSAVNAKMTVLYCSTIPAFGFGPLSDDSVIIETKEQLSCRPCGLHGHSSCPEKHFRCAKTIPVSSLLSRV
jgi:heptosyltransferase II